MTSQDRLDGVMDGAEIRGLDLVDCAGLGEQSHVVGGVRPFVPDDGLVAAAALEACKMPLP